MISIKVLLNSGSVVNSRNVTWVWLRPSIPVSAKNVRSVFVSREGGELDPSRHGVVKRDKYVDCDESSESTSVFGQESLHAWLLRLLRLSHAGKLQRQTIEVPPRLLP